MTRARDASALVGQCALVTEDTHECDRVSKGSQGMKNLLPTALLTCSPVFPKPPPSVLPHSLLDTRVGTVTETPSPR